MISSRMFLDGNEVSSKTFWSYNRFFHAGLFMNPTADYSLFAWWAICLRLKTKK